jgi:hypothetical protein
VSRGRARNRTRNTRRVQRLQREMHLVHDADADAAAGIVGDEFAVRMTSPWGDRWEWEVDAAVAQQVNNLLGRPRSFVHVSELLSTPVDKPGENS